MLSLLVTRARSGDPDARDALVRALLPTVLPWVARLGGPRIDREEAAHDVLLTVLRRLPDLEGDDRLLPWLFGITRKIVASHRRRAWLRRWVPGIVAERADPTPQADRALAERALAAELQALLELLPTAQREVLVLCELEERTHTEVARLLGVPEGTVKSRLRLGRTRLSALVTERCPHLLPELADA